MRAFRNLFVSALLLPLSLLSTQQARADQAREDQVRAELVASTENTDFAYLTPLRNGLSAITLVWSIDRPTQDRIARSKASLSSVVSGGTSSRSPNEIHAFRALKGVRQSIRINGRNLLLTVSAPDDVFPETLVHLENLLLEPEYLRDWYARELQEFSLESSSKTRRPSDVLNEVSHFLAYEPNDPAVVESEGPFRFGRPSQALLRSGDQKVERRARRLLNKLPRAKATWEWPFESWAKALTGLEERPFALPEGTIHFADPSSTEMLILFVKAEEFTDDNDQIGANLLMDYIGANQGSEMFRIIRQEMRAAYNPHSDFIVMNKNQSVISLSATVEAEKWPEIHGVMREIYKNARAGKIEQAGLEIQHDQMEKSYFNRFFYNPIWGAQHYLNEYPTGTLGTITIPLFEALETASIDKIVANTETHLPPLDGFLLILIGGGVAPAEALKSKGYCSLPKNTPLSFCLDALSNVQS